MSYLLPLDPLDKERGDLGECSDISFLYQDGLLEFRRLRMVTTHTSKVLI